MHDLGLGEATGINDNGQVVGGSFFGPKFEATLWHNGWAWDLGIRGRAVAINNKGQVLVMTDGPDSVPYLWENGASHALPTSPRGSHRTAENINSSGQIVGGSVTSDGKHPCALLWQGDRVYDLNTLIPANSGWVLDEAHAINNKGWIVGVGRLNRDYHAFLLTPR